MTDDDRQRFGPVAALLKDGREVTIRPLTAGDAEALGELFESVPRKDLRFYRPYPLTREQAQKLAQAADDPRNVTLVLEAPDGQLAGYAWFRWKADSERSGFGLCIRRDHQSAGAGAALLTRILEIARHVGPAVMRLEVQIANVRALQLYRKMGFEVISERMTNARPDLGYAAEPEYIMDRRVR